jgi:hypothetical protein
MFTEKLFRVPAGPDAEVAWKRVGLVVVDIVGEYACTQCFLPRLPFGAIGWGCQRIIQRIQTAGGYQLPNRECAASEVGWVSAEDAWLDFLIYAWVAPEVDFYPGVQLFVLPCHVLMPLNTKSTFEHCDLDRLGAIRCDWFEMAARG